MEAMSNTIYYIFVFIGGLGWGMYIQEMITKRQRIKARESRIVIDAPFSRDQSDTIMRVLQEINESIKKSTEVNP